MMHMSVDKHQIGKSILGFEVSELLQASFVYSPSPIHIYILYIYLMWRAYYLTHISDGVLQGVCLFLIYQACKLVLL